MWNEKSFDTSTALAIDGSQHKFLVGGNNNHTEFGKKGAAGIVNVKPNYRGNNTHMSMSLDENNSGGALMQSIGFFKQGKIHRNTEIH